MSRLSDGSPLQGARVTVAAPGQPPITASTAADGTFSLDVGGGGPYGVSVEATGFATQSLAQVQPGTPLSIALDTATFTPLPVHAGSVSSVAGDATSGIFYAVMNLAPELYRTLDYGGTWQLVPMRYEDPDTGLDRGPGANDVVASSGVAGEVATASPDTSGDDTGVRYSTDYGLTWRTVGGPVLPGIGQLKFLFWGHAGPGAPSVLIYAHKQADGSWSVWRADMSASSPSLTQEPGDPFGTGSVIAAAHAGDGAFLGRVTAAGELSFARLTATGPIAFGASEVSGLPSPPDLLRLGGAREASSPPDGALVVGGNPFTATLLTKSPGAPTFAGGSFSTPSTVPGSCRFPHVFGYSAGSVAPTSSGTAGSGSVAQCWVTKTGTTLTYHDTCCESGNISYDADWGASNHVLLRTGSNGPSKAARLDANGVPEFLPAADATPGPGPNTGGLSVAGIVSALVEDTAYGPSASLLAVGVSGSGGQLTLASRNGGQSFSRVLNRGWGAEAAQWWQGASGEWLVFGGLQGASSGEQLSAALNWDGVSSLGQPNVQGSRPQDLGDPAGTMGYGIQTLHAVPGTDTVFIALGREHDPLITGDSHLYRARIVPGSPPSLADLFSFDSALAGVAFYNPQALAYCPSSAPDARMRDVLFVATGAAGGQVPLGEWRGSLLRITQATSASPTVTEIASLPHGADHTVLYDVRADCARGVVYTGGMAGPGAVYKSTDGGLEFTRIPISGPGEPGATGMITAIGVDPADPNEVQVAAGTGLILTSSDGGSTWTVVNNPLVHRPMPVRDIEFAPGGGGFTRATAARLAVLGTGSGAFRGDVSVSSGVIAMTASGLNRTQVTKLSSDGQPVAVSYANGTSAAVFRRSNGLYYASTSRRAGWSLPILIPGTSRGGFPAAARDSGGRLRVAFARTGQAPGIYVVSRSAAGVWSAPVRVSKGVGDTLPAIAVAGRRAVDLVFLRTRGARGVHYVSMRGRRWGKPHRLRGTGANDAKPVLGGPEIVARSGQLHIAFARGGRQRGIIYMRRRGSRWSTPTRLTRSADSQPTIAVARGGVRAIVFRRGGLMALRGVTRWSLVRIPRTSAAATEPSLSANASGFTLVFARRGRSQPGIYLTRTAAASRRWSSARPTRVTTSPNDRNPSVRAETMTFERG